MDNVTPIVFSFAVPIILWIIWLIIRPLIMKSEDETVKVKEYPIDKRNMKKEKELLADLLEDIKNNAYAWTYTNYDLSSMTSSSIINDVKNIAIIVGQGSGNLLRTTKSIAVSYGLKDITKYNQHTTDNVCIHLHGKHVTDFCIQVEDHLDTRGLELDYFKEQVKRKL